MTARTLRLYAMINNAVDHLALPPQQWRDCFTPTTVGTLICEIDRLRVLVGEIPSYMSDGTVREMMEELLGPYTE
jgi:hypothetical protein